MNHRCRQLNQKKNIYNLLKSSFIYILIPAATVVVIKKNNFFCQNVFFFCSKCLQLLGLVAIFFQLLFSCPSTDFLH